MAIPLLPYSDSSITIPLVADFVMFSYSDICSPLNQDVYCVLLLDVIIIIPMTVPHYCNISLFFLLLNKKASLKCCIIRSLFDFALFLYSIYFPPLHTVGHALFGKCFYAGALCHLLICLCLLVFLAAGVLFADGKYGNVTSFF